MRHIPKDKPLANACTLAIIVITTIVWLLQIRRPGLGTQLALHQLQAPGFRVYQFVTYAFAHGSWFHIVMNMITFLSFGQALEMVMGRARLALIYLAGTLAAACLYLLIPINKEPMMGASGAVMAVMAATMYLYPRRKVRLFFILVLDIWVIVPIMVVITLFSNYQGSPVAHMAHLAGVLVGLIMARAYRGPRKNWDR